MIDRSTTEPYASLYVSPTGAVGNPGTPDEPFATVTQARDHVRTISGAMTGDIIVNVLAGRYYHDQPLTFDERDSARQGYRIIYRREGDGDAVLVGGRPVSGWTPAGNGVYEASIGPGRKVHTLYENGRRARPARTPKSGHYTAEAAVEGNEKRAFHFRDGDLDESMDLIGAGILVWPGGTWDFFVEIRTIAHVDWERRTIELTKPSCDRLDSGTRYYVQGAKPLMTDPGEYYVDSITGTLFYRPFGDDLDAAEVVVPSVRNLLDLRGAAPNHPVTGLSFEGLTLTSTDFDDHYDMRVGQAINDESGTARSGLVFMENAEDNTIRGCLISNAGFSGVMLSHHAQRNAIYGCRIEGVGFNGIYLSGWYPGGGDFASVEASHVNRDNLVSNNHIVDCGQLIGQGSGVQLYQSGENTVSHNEIHRISRYGISLKGNRYNILRDSMPSFYGTELTYDNHWDALHTRNNRIEFNDVYDVLTNSQDGGGIEAWGPGKGNVIHHNRIHDITCGAPGGAAIGIYMDDNADYFTISSNLVYEIYGTRYYSVLVFVKGIHNIVRNNVLYQAVADDNPGMLFVAHGGERNDHLVLLNNVIHRSGADLVYRFSQDDEQKRPTSVNFADEKVCVSDFNVFFHDSDRYRIQSLPEDYAWDEWRAAEGDRFDRNSVLADPLFKDVQSRDFSLTPESPALALGFVDIDQRLIGLKPDFPDALREA